MAEAVREVLSLYSIYADLEEFEGIRLAIGLMLENEHTHEHWHEILGPVLAELDRVYVDEYDL